MKQREKFLIVFNKKNLEITKKEYIFAMSNRNNINKYFLNHFIY